MLRAAGAGGPSPSLAPVAAAGAADGDGGGRDGDEANPGQASETTPAARVEVQGNLRFRSRERTLFCLPDSHMVNCVDIFGAAR